MNDMDSYKSAVLILGQLLDLGAFYAQMARLCTVYGGKGYCSSDPRSEVSVVLTKEDAVKLATEKVRHYRRSYVDDQVIIEEVAKRYILESDNSLRCMRWTDAGHALDDFVDACKNGQWDEILRRLAYHRNLVIFYKNICTAYSSAESADEVRNWERALQKIQSIIHLTQEVTNKSDERPPC